MVCFVTIKAAVLEKNLLCIFPLFITKLLSFTKVASLYHHLLVYTINSKSDTQLAYCVICLNPNTLHIMSFNPATLWWTCDLRRWNNSTEVAERVGTAGRSVTRWFDHTIHASNQYNILPVNKQATWTTWTSETERKKKSQFFWDLKG